VLANNLALSSRALLGGARNSGQVLWTPLNLGASLLAWWDAQDLTKFVFNAGKVASWTDTKSGIAATQATAGFQPAYNAAGFGAKAGLVFVPANTTSLAVAALASSTVPLTVFAVCNSAVATGAIIGSTANAGLEFRTNNGSGLQFELLSQQTASLGVSNNASVANTNAFVLATYDGNNFAFRVNGSPANNGVNAFGLAGAGSTTIGSAPGELFSGTLGDILKMNSVATLSQQQKIEGFEAWKYGLQALLPAGHPYKARAPFVSDP
jgi:hypothetical protein